MKLRLYKTFVSCCKLALMLTMFVVSCRKDDSLNLKELYVYMAPGIEAYNVSSGNLALVNNAVFGNYIIAFPAHLSRPFIKDVQVTAAVSYDSILLRAYDSAYKISSPSQLLPAGAFTLANNGTVIIKAGTTASADSIRLVIADVSKIVSGTTYIVPVSLTTADNKLPVSNNRQVMYLKVMASTLLTGISSFTNSSQVDITLKRESGVNSGTDKVYVKAFINQAVSASVSVKVQDNPALLQDYNARNNTNYKPFPSGAFHIAKKEVAITPGNTEAADSLLVAFPDLSLFNTGEGYLLPIEVTEPAAGNPSADPLKRVLYLHVYVFENNIDPSNNGLSGTNVSRAGWSLTVTGTVMGSAADLIDDNINTGWVSGYNLPQGITIDMKASQTIKGFFLEPNYAWTSFGVDFINMDVLSSTNGVTWKLEGKYIGAPVLGQPDTRSVKFITPVTTRYFRLTTTKSTLSGYTGMSEINAVQ